MEKNYILLDASKVSTIQQYIIHTQRGMTETVYVYIHRQLFYSIKLVSFPLASKPFFFR